MPRAGRLLTMDTAGYTKWDSRLEEVPGGHWGRWGRRLLFLALVLVAALALWALILSILFSKASTERGALFGHQDLLRTNASKQKAALGVLNAEVRACNSCCSGTQTLLERARAELGEAQAKLIEQESALKELSDRVTQSLAEAGRDREDIRSELFRALEAARLGNSSCEECPASWLPFQGSCYLFSILRATWEESQRNCAGSGGHLVIVGDLEEQGFLSRNTRGRGYWLGLRAVRRARQIQGYQWVDGVPLSFSHWNLGEPNDSMGREDCVMMLRTGMWNDAPCDNERDNWICEKRRSC
ncbi:C-type lectin domain family 4 member G isoform X1 [Leopardus geoffroyi]|uniref:C-type lectin domain family 4 member G isoform X1 n=1 Tax=Leopardus geoffroyi TaxID=46844 RepID=UPI001E261B42|nr:C-type lectin domain family 4 member G isoform X1 [Leopardus geoffroyi]